MTATVCLTVDVEDWYDGMAVLGKPIPRPPAPGVAWTAWPTCSEDRRRTRA